MLPTPLRLTLIIPEWGAHSMLLCDMFPVWRVRCQNAMALTLSAVRA
jgi:hypothetical protein